MRRDKTDGRTDRQTVETVRARAASQPASQPACLWESFSTCSTPSRPCRATNSASIDITAPASCVLPLHFLLPPTLSTFCAHLPLSRLSFTPKLFNSSEYSTLRHSPLSVSLSLSLRFFSFFPSFFLLLFLSFILFFSFAFNSSPPLPLHSPPTIRMVRLLGACTCTVGDLAVDDVISGVCSFNLDNTPFSSRLLSRRSTRNCPILERIVFRRFSGILLVPFFKFPLFLSPVFFFSLSFVGYFLIDEFNALTIVISRFVRMGRLLIMHTRLICRFNDMVMYY